MAASGFAPGRKVMATWETARPGVKLRSDSAGNRAFVKGFSRADDGSMLEAERHGDIRAGYELVAVGDVSLTADGPQPFTEIMALLKAASRPLTVTFLTPPTPLYKDRYGFVRDEEYVRKEVEVTEATFLAAQAVSMQWLELMKSLGGSSAPWEGLLGLRRDQLGLLSYCVKAGAVHAQLVNTRTPDVEAQRDVEPIMFLHKRCWDARGSVGVPPVAVTGSGVTDGGGGGGGGGGAAAAAAAGDTAARVARAGAGSGGDGDGARPRSRLRRFLGASLPPLARPKGLLTQLHALVLAGIPAAYRGGVWFELSGAASRQLLFPPDFYIKLVARGGSKQSMYDICKDVDRTFPGHAFFEDEATQLALARVLTAFAARNPEIGYCQSTNFLGGVLLLLQEEDQAFWMMDVIVNELLPPDYYTGALTGVHADQRVLSALLKEWLPEVADVLTGMGIDVSVICLEWFMALFSTSLPTHCALRVWDVFLVFGSEVLFRVSLALFYLNKDAILAARGDIPKLFSLLQTMPSHQHDADELLQVAFPEKRKLSVSLKLQWAGLSNRVLAPMRGAARAAIVAELQESVMKRSHRASSESPASRRRSVGPSGPSRSPSPPLPPPPPPRASPTSPPPPPRALSSAALSATPPARRSVDGSPPPPPDLNPADGDAAGGDGRAQASHLRGLDLVHMVSPITTAPGTSKPAAP